MVAWTDCNCDFGYIVLLQSTERNPYILDTLTAYLLSFSSIILNKILQYDKPMLFLKSRKHKFMFGVCSMCFLAMHNIVLKIEANKSPMLCPQILILHQKFK